MNGIDYSTLFGNTNLLTQNNGIQGQQFIKGKISGIPKEDKKKTAQEQDTVEINGKSREIPSAGYQKPSKVVPQEKQEETFKLDETGVEEGIELSDAAKQLLSELKEKYGNMEFRVAHWTSEEEADYYASQCKKEYSVLIDPEILEEMAADTEVRSQYEAILDGAGAASQKVKEELGEDAEQVETFTISIDRNGTVSYSIKLIQDFQEKNAQQKEDMQDRIQEKREQKKAEEKERITANSLEELIAAVKERLAEN